MGFDVIISKLHEFIVNYEKRSQNVSFPENGNGVIEGKVHPQHNDAVSHVCLDNVAFRRKLRASRAFAFDPTLREDQSWRPVQPGQVSACYQDCRPKSSRTNARLQEEIRTYPGKTQRFMKHYLQSKEDSAQLWTGTLILQAMRFKYFGVSSFAKGRKWF